MRKRKRKRSCSANTQRPHRRRPGRADRAKLALTAAGGRVPGLETWRTYSALIQALVLRQECMMPSSYRTSPPPFCHTSTVPNYYTGLIETSKTHFYGRAAAGLSFSDSVLRTFTRLWWAVSIVLRRGEQLSFGTESDHTSSACVTDVPAATATSSGQRSLVNCGGRRSSLGRTGSAPCRPPSTPRGVEFYNMYMDLHVVIGALLRPRSGRAEF